MQSLMLFSENCVYSLLSYFTQDEAFFSTSKAGPKRYMRDATIFRIFIGKFEEESFLIC